MKISPIEIFYIVIQIPVVLLIVSFYAYKRKVREDFTRELCVLMECCIEKVRNVWGYQNGIERFLATMRRDHIKKLEDDPDCDKYLSYLMLEKLKDQKFKNFDFKALKTKYLDFKDEDLSVKSFLVKLIDRADMYSMRHRSAIEFNFTEVVGFSGPQKIYIKIFRGLITIIFLESLNQFISFEIREPLNHFLENDGGCIKRQGSFGFLMNFSKNHGKLKVDFHSHEWNEDFHFECYLKTFEEAVNVELLKYQVS